MTTVQTWAHEDEDKVLTRTVDEQPIDKKQKKCEKNCKPNNDPKIQTNNSTSAWKRFRNVINGSFKNDQYAFFDEGYESFKFGNAKQNK